MKAHLAAAVWIVLCNFATAAVVESSFGQLREGGAVQSFTITTSRGASIRLISYGAAIQSLNLPDRDGHVANIVLGFDNMQGYQRNNPFFGAIVGRYANRIRGGAFTLEGISYKVTPSDRGNTLHGGRRGFDKVNWTGTKIDDQTIEFVYASRDGEEGFPGNLSARVRYTLSENNELKIEYFATTDKPTVINLTNHSYFNLAGAGEGDVLKQELMIDADQFTPIDPQGIPTSSGATVEGTPFDFRQPHAIGERIATDSDQIRAGNGYDHNFILTHKDSLRLAASVRDPISGRTLQIMTIEPGIQFYSGNGLNGSITGTDGKKYVQHAGFCLEPQHFPDSPNHPEFPSTQLKPGESYHTVSLYQFGAK